MHTGFKMSWLVPTTYTWFQCLFGVFLRWPRYVENSLGTHVIVMTMSTTRANVWTNASSHDVSRARWGHVPLPRRRHVEMCGQILRCRHVAGVALPCGCLVVTTGLC